MSRALLNAALQTMMLRGMAESVMIMCQTSAGSAAQGSGLFLMVSRRPMVSTVDSFSVMFELISSGVGATFSLSVDLDFFARFLKDSFAFVVSGFRLL